MIAFEDSQITAPGDAIQFTVHPKAIENKYIGIGLLDPSESLN